MALSLTEYYAQTPEPEETPQAAPGRSYQDARQERETVDQIKASILAQLEQGNAPQDILYSALRVIGMLTQDNEWTEAGTAILERTYSDIAQRSLFAEDASLVLDRLETLRAEYVAKAKRQLTKYQRDTQNLSYHINRAMEALGALEGNPEEE